MESLTLQPGKALSRFSSKQVVQLGIFTALALMIHIIEAPLPRPLPWVKLGLANTVPLVLIHLMGLPEALAVSFLRTVIGALVLGTFMSPAFILSFSGAIMSTLVMAVLYHYLYPRLTFIGLSILGALTHNMSQLLVAYVLFFKSLNLGELSLVMLMPTLIIFAIPSGILVGYFSYAISRRLTEADF